MNNYRKFFVVGVAVAMLMVSCRKEGFDLQNPNTRTCKSYVEQFETIWQGINNTYVFWSRDTVDWEARYAKYHPIFESFDAHGADSAEYLNAWRGVVNGLLDHHMTLLLWNPNGKYRIGIHAASNSYSHETDEMAQLNILQKQPGIRDFTCYYVGNNNFVNSAYCLLPGKTAGKYIAYLRFSSFSIDTMSKANFANKDKAEAPFRAFYGDQYAEGVTNGAVNRDDVEAIILDVRNNGGGYISDISPAVVSLLQKNYQHGYSRFKEGYGRLDYSSWVPVVFDCPKNYIKQAKPIVALVDINTVSSAELSAQAIKSIPNGTVVGERTYGATCPLVANTDRAFNVYYTGCFGDQDLLLSSEKRPRDPNSYAYYVYSSTFDLVTNEYQSLEGVGVQPDIKVLYDADKLAAGVDTQLEAALEFLRKGN